MYKKYRVSGVMTKKSVDVDFSYETESSNEWMAAIDTNRWIKQAFEALTIEVTSVEPLEAKK